MSPLSLHIAVLDCDTPVPNVYAERGLYSDIFEALLRDGLTKTEGLQELELRFSKYDCVRGELPSVEDLEGIGGIIITGSGTLRQKFTHGTDILTFPAASAYDPAPWIQTLTEYTRSK